MRSPVNVSESCKVVLVKHVHWLCSVFNRGALQVCWADFKGRWVTVSDDDTIRLWDKEGVQTQCFDYNGASLVIAQRYKVLIAVGQP